MKKTKEYFTEGTSRYCFRERMRIMLNRMYKSEMVTSIVN